MLLVIHHRFTRRLLTSNPQSCFDQRPTTLHDLKKHHSPPLPTSLPTSKWQWVCDGRQNLYIPSNPGAFSIPARCSGASLSTWMTTLPRPESSSILLRLDFILVERERDHNVALDKTVYVLTGAGYTPIHIRLEHALRVPSAQGEDAEIMALTSTSPLIQEFTPRSMPALNVGSVNLYPY